MFAKLIAWFKRQKSKRARRSVAAGRAVYQCPKHGRQTRAVWMANKPFCPRCWAHYGKRIHMMTVESVKVYRGKS